MRVLENIARAEANAIRRGFNLADTHRIISEEEATWRRGISTDTLRRLSDRAGKPRRYRLSPRRIGYLLREILEM
jgi:predicted DNA-binding transcriptional regulator AlpA